MDTNSVSSVQKKTPTKRSKPKKKPIKVVYISNPMKVKTSASEFRALVQELTGQYAELPPDPSRFQDLSSDDSGDGGRELETGHQMDSSYNYSVTKIIGDENDDTHGVPQVDLNHSKGQLGSSMEGFEPFGDVDVDVFAPQMIENISAFLPSSVFYDSSAQVDQVLSLHAV